VVRRTGLIVHDLGVTFVDGEAEVDAKTAARWSC
jgi:hypothetical protein